MDEIKEINFNETGDIIDTLSGISLKDTPEERVRQIFVVECKKPTVTEGYTQLVSYIYNTSAIGGVWTNGEGMYVYKKRNGGEIGLDEILTLPRYREGWSGGDSIPSKSSLPRPHKVRFLLWLGYFWQKFRMKLHQVIFPVFG